MASEEFKYKHVTKVPWIATLIWTALLAWIFGLYPMSSFLSSFLRLFLFGVSWWFLFQSLDEIATHYRRRILFKTPELKSAYIASKLADWESETE